MTRLKDLKKVFLQIYFYHLWFQRYIKNNKNKNYKNKKKNAKMRKQKNVWILSCHKCLLYVLQNWCLYIYMSVYMHEISIYLSIYLPIHIYIYTFAVWFLFRRVLNYQIYRWKEQNKYVGKRWRDVIKVSCLDTYIWWIYIYMNMNIYLMYI